MCIQENNKNKEGEIYLMERKGTVKEKTAKKTDLNNKSELKKRNNPRKTNRKEANQREQSSKQWRSFIWKTISKRRIVK